LASRVLVRCGLSRRSKAWQAGQRGARYCAVSFGAVRQAGFVMKCPGGASLGKARLILAGMARMDLGGESGRVEACSGEVRQSR
jgi:hypothetical protein